MTESSDPDPMQGRLLDARYRIDDFLARGGMASVYTGVDIRLDRTVAIKVLSPLLAENPDFRDRFTREALSAARLLDPNVVSVFDQGTDGTTAYLVMEYMPGTTLRELLQRCGRLQPRQALDIFEPVVSGLAAAHQIGLIHRDLKPENILIGEDGRVKIADFGLARPATSTTASDDALLGTVAYLAPELLARSSADQRSDIYSLGVILFEMLTGQQPYQGEQAMQIAYQHAHNDMPLPGSRVDGIPAELDDLVSWTTHRDPIDRPADAHDLLEQTRDVRRELGYPSVQTRSFMDLLDAAPTPVGEQATTRLSPTAVAPAALFGSEADVSPVADPAAGTLPANTAENRLRTGLRRTRRRGGWLAAIIVVAFAVCAGASWFTVSGPGALRTVPAVTKLTVAQAQTQLQSLGFVVTQRTANSLSVPTGAPIGTDPRAGSGLTQRSAITLIVSTGPKIIAVPQVAGATLSTARQTLTQAGFLVASAHDEIFDRDTPSGSVIRALGPDGASLGDSARLPQGTKISLTTSLGAVPSVVGQSLSAAQTTLKNAGLNGVQSGSDYSDTVPAGNVISAAQASDPLKRGGTVNLVVSKGAQMVSIPDVTGQTVSAATAALQNAGFTVSTDVPGSLQGLLPVTSSDPSAGTQVKKGSAVTLHAILSW